MPVGGASSGRTNPVPLPKIDSATAQQARGTKRAAQSDSESSGPERASGKPPAKVQVRRPDSATSQPAGSGSGGPRPGAPEGTPPGFPANRHPDRPDTFALYDLSYTHPAPAPAQKLEPTGSFVADEKNSIADAMFRRSYDTKMNSVAHDPQKLREFESQEHAQVYEVRRNSQGVPSVYPTSSELISGSAENLFVRVPGEHYTPTSFQMTHSHFGPTMYENPKLQNLPANVDIYTVNPIGSLPDQKIAATTRLFGMGSTPPGNMKYNTMYNPDRDQMVAYDGKFDPKGYLNHFVQERKPEVRLPPPPWKPQDGVPLSHGAANSNGLVAPIDPKLWGSDGEYGGGGSASKKL